MKKRFYVTTAIDYVNAEPHIGHAYQKIVADALARWYRLRGEKVFFLTGTDEHGKKVATSAEESGKTPKEFVDEVSKKFKDAWKELNIRYDRFIRTTDKDHEKFVQDFIKKIKKDIYKGRYEGLYCVGCERFYTEKDLINGECQFHPGKKLEKLKEETYYFKLGKYQKQLLKLYEDKVFVLPKERRKEIKNRVKEGLQDLSITRTNFEWGIPFPLDKEHVVYVWFDALLNYLTGAGEKQKFWPANAHLLGKDNGWFHAVIWPAMLLSAGYKLPKTIFIHGFLTFNKQKISKSLGNSIFPKTLAEKYSSDTIRYYVLRHFPFGQDGDFSEKALIKRHNGELANKLGNLISRTSALAEKYGIEKKTRDQPLSPKWKKALEDDKAEYDEIIKSINSNEGVIRLLKMKEESGLDALLLSYPQPMNEVTQEFVKRYMESFQIDKALNIIFAFIDTCNEFLQLRKPWENSKSIKYRKWVLGETVRAIREIAELLLPFIPESAEKIKKQFSATKIKKQEILFKKIK